MRRPTTWLTALAATGVLVLGTAACADDPDASPQTAEQLATALVGPGDLAGTWTPHTAPDEAAIDGVVTADQQDMLPRLELCDQASEAARAAAADLQWKAFRQLDLAVDDPIDPPDRSGHIVFVQEFLTSGDTDTITATFDQLRVGMDACLGDIPAGEEGPATAATMVMPRAGDDRFAVRTVMEEAGGWAMWRMHQLVVRSGSTLMTLLVVEIHSTDVDPLVTDDAIAAMVDTAVEQL